MVTSEQLARLGIGQEWLNSLNETFQKFNISTVDEQSAFIGQYSHESNHFKTLQENLNYRPETLLQLFPLTPKRSWGFTPESANEYAHQPIRIANRIYSNRMGNRDEASGDGWRFHGRGLPQLTGHDLYWHFGQYIGEDLVANPDLVATPQYAALAGGWYWATHNCNQIAQAEDWETLTKRINGGLIGLDDRKNLTQHAIQILSA